MWATGNPLNLVWRYMLQYLVWTWMMPSGLEMG